MITTSTTPTNPTPISPLREQMRQALRVRNVSRRTERTYICLVARFAQLHHRSPARLGIEQILAYLFHLRDSLKVSHCLFNQSVCDSLFLSPRHGPA